MTASKIKSLGGPVEVFHGSDKDNVCSIKMKGFDPKRMGQETRRRGHGNNMIHGAGFYMTTDRKNACTYGRYLARSILDGKKIADCRPYESCMTKDFEHWSRSMYNVLFPKGKEADHYEEMEFYNARLGMYLHRHLGFDGVAYSMLGSRPDHPDDEREADIVLFNNRPVRSCNVFKCPDTSYWAYNSQGKEVMPHPRMLYEYGDMKELSDEELNDW